MLLKKLYMISGHGLFNINKISIYDNFFHLGGDSLLSIKLASRIYDKFNIKIDINQIFDYPTIETLSEIIDSLSSNDYTASITIQPKAEFYPTSSAQKRIYLASSMDKNSYLYNITGGILLDSMPDIAKLQNALDLIVLRHDILRTYFEVVNGQIVQKVSDELQIKIDIQEVNTNNPYELFYIYGSNFDLNKAPLFNVTLFNLPNGKVLFMLDIHHIIFDGTSLNNLILELSSIYNDKELPTLDISYKDFAIWENNKLKNNEFKNSKEFWLKEFKGEIPILNLPTTLLRPADKTYEGNTFVSFVSSELTKKINEFSNKYNITPYMLMLSAYYILLYKYTNQEDIVVGTPISGRTLKELEPLLGMFVNSIPLRNYVHSNIKFEEFLDNVKTSCINAFAHQDYPFDVLVNDLKVSKDASRSPLFDTMFIYQNMGIEKCDFGGINADFIAPISNTSKFDISLEVLPLGDELKLSFEYCTKLFDSIFIGNFAKHYENILSSILDNPNTPIAKMSMVQEEEKNNILYKFNNINFEAHKKYPGLFDNQLENSKVFSSFTNFNGYDNIVAKDYLNDNRVYILDKDMNVCPIGIPGEIYIAGDNLRL